MWYAVYDPAGGVIQAPTLFVTGHHALDPSVSATADGFVIAFEDQGWGTGGYDITQTQFAPDGTFLRGSNVSNPGLVADGLYELGPSVARLSNNYLAVAYTRTDAGGTVVALVDPGTGGVLGTRIVLGGEPITDNVRSPTVTGFANGGIAVFHENFTDVDVDGEQLQAQRTSVGDAAANTITGDSFTDVMLGNGGNDTLRGLDGNDRLVGGNENDRLLGGNGDDRLLGGNGIDRLTGGKGVDIMTGGPGPDRIIFTKTGESALTNTTRDHVTDFVHLTDDLDLAAIDAKTGDPGNDIFSFRGKMAFNAEGQVRVVQSGDHTIVQLNTTGTNGAEMTIQLDNFTATALTQADFVF